MLKRSLRLKAKEDAKKEDSKEDDSVLTDIETYSNFESPEESGEAFQGILNSIGGLLSRFSGAAANISESTSSMVLEEMVYGVSHENTGCTAFVHVPKEKRQALDDRSEECILIAYGSGKTYRLVTKKTRKFIIAGDVKFDESLLGFGNFRNKVEPFYINDDDEEKEDAQAPIEDVQEPTGEKPAFKKAKEVQPVDLIVRQTHISVIQRELFTSSSVLLEANNEVECVHSRACRSK